MHYQTKTHTNQILSNQGAKEMNSTQKRRRKNKGFTLLEVLLVMAILIILMSLVGAGYFTYFANSQEDAARLQMTSIKQAVNGYYMKTGQRPQSIQDLVTPLHSAARHGRIFIGKLLLEFGANTRKMVTNLPIDNNINLKTSYYSTLLST